MQRATWTGGCGEGDCIGEFRECEIEHASPEMAKGVGSNPALDTIFPMFITPTTLVAVTRILYKLHAKWLLDLPCAL